jgi:hypothetical protein
MPSGRKSFEILVHEEVTLILISDELAQRCGCLRKIRDRHLQPRRVRQILRHTTDKERERSTAHTLHLSLAVM